jgi:hypothetical protein
MRDYSTLPDQKIAKLNRNMMMSDMELMRRGDGELIGPRETYEVGLRKI